MYPICPQNSLTYALKLALGMLVLMLVLPACSEQPPHADTASEEANDPTRFTYETLADGLEMDLM